jgi:hypothetical protein
VTAPRPGQRSGWEHPAAALEAGVSTLRVEPLAHGLPARLALIERVRKLIDDL